jgi:hypothetical protein
MRDKNFVLTLLRMGGTITSVMEYGGSKVVFLFTDHLPAHVGERHKAALRPYCPSPTLAERAFVLNQKGR